VTIRKAITSGKLILVEIIIRSLKSNHKELDEHGRKRKLRNSMAGAGGCP